MSYVVGLLALVVGFGFGYFVGVFRAWAAIAKILGIARRNTMHCLTSARADVESAINDAENIAASCVKAAETKVVSAAHRFEAVFEYAAKHIRLP